jgi:hypothetical protein
MMKRSERSASWARHGAGIHSVTKLRDLIKAGGIDPLREFRETAREEPGVFRVA